MNRDRGTHLPTSEAEWLETGKFHIEGVTVNGVPIRCAVVRGQENKRQTTMVGGIPREIGRQKALPLINKLYGLLALELEKHGQSSLLYNQPTTGGSGGRWETETLKSRTAILAGLIDHYRKQLAASDIAMIGSSAGAYMAVGAVELIQAQGGHVSKLILLSPAAYPEKIKDVDIRNYAKHILRKRPVYEKREVLSHLRSKMVLKEKKLSLVA